MHYRQLNVLLVEDSEDDAELIVRQLEKAGFTVRYNRVDTKVAMRDAFSDRIWDAVISDYMMPNFDAIAALELMKEIGLDLPFIIVSGKIGEETAVAAMRAGAHDYLMKNNLTRLGPALERELRDARMRREKKIAERNASELQAFKNIDKLHRQFLSNVSHELRTPLATIKGFATTLLSTDIVWSEGEKKDFLITIDQETDRLTQMIEGLMDVSRIESGELHLDRTICGVREIFDSVKNELHRLTAAHKLKVSIPANILPVYADCMRIGQVLVNLVDNAVKNSNTGTVVEITVSQTSRCTTLSVIDRGKGIPAELQEKIFNRFYQYSPVEGNNRGVGLGLAICKGIIKAHGGRIWVKSEPGTGSTFNFALPLANHEK
ncbi:MAG: hybrid sensor histidine kinase/response regulator [Dehalococcoidia bacterium]|nr:MAG: hybrid sensor histidine kinase/response regulator [Dehalococcoidia bacterium]